MTGPNIQYSNNAETPVSFSKFSDENFTYATNVFDKRGSGIFSVR